MITDKIECKACGRQIDSAAKLCPYCGANPETGVRFDPTPILREHFPTAEQGQTRQLLDFLRNRQALVIGAVVIAMTLLAFGLHALAERRNSRAVSDVPAVPLTEVADLSNREAETEELPIPDLELEHDGNPSTMRRFLVEPGAVAPPEPVAAPPQAPSPSPNRVQPGAGSRQAPQPRISPSPARDIATPPPTDLTDSAAPSAGNDEPPQP
ncbi:MAG TPA: zinc ribbon domain-containing protein [Thermoanaerobaculia bacterium]|nr:zinc ribbon domain-containing protein [Thermoanaerobaculia bacterium]